MVHEEANYVACIRNADYPASLEPLKIYPRLSDSRAEQDGLIRVVDESGEDYLYPADYFVSITMPAFVGKRFEGSLGMKDLEKAIAQMYSEIGAIRLRLPMEPSLELRFNRLKDDLRHLQAVESELIRLKKDMSFDLQREQWSELLEHARRALAA